MGRKHHMRISVLFCVLLGLAVAAGVRLSGQTTSPQPRRLVAGAQTGVQPESSFQLPITSGSLPESEPVSPSPPTRSTFMASWEPVSGAKGDLLGECTGRTA